MKLTRWIAIVGLAALLFAPVGAFAHPHVWIDMSTKLLFDKNGHVRALEIYWLFDPFYSAHLGLSIRQIEKAGKKNAHRTFAGEMAGRLRKHSYFTEATADGKRLRFARHLDASSGKIDSGKNQGRFWTRFTIEFEKPVNPKRQNFVYAVYDPTYYIEILHVEKKPAFTLAGIAPNQCLGRLIKPNPDAEARMFAAALDKTQSGGNDLGRLFAEKVALQCK
ncbi:MAG: hypothetical protein CMM48_13470 [Rhodospirillaceae bacterium]|nr:hypothetical protein [Rhodospirillaceae bacterium]HAA92715.1 hypothetical protein [Rhodospirillaceae bacterium]